MLIEKTVQRFHNNYIKVESGCWEWQKSKTRFGYGKFKMKPEQLAHRVSFLLHNGELPRDRVVMHSCDNPPCVNPEHLSLGTLADNNKDRADKKRNNHRNDGKTICIRGHKFTVSNTYVRPSDKTRVCRKCQSLKQRGLV